MSRPQTKGAARRLALERLESRDVPALLVQVVDLPLQSFSRELDAISTDGTLLIAGGDGVRGGLRRVSSHGELLETIDLTPAAGLPDVNVIELSEDGRWAVGYSYHSGVFNAESQPPSYLTLWQLDDPETPIVLDVFSGQVALPNLRSVAAISNLGTFGITTSDGRLLLIGPEGVEELALPPDAPTGSTADFTRISGISVDGTLLVGRTLSPTPDDESPAHLTYRATAWRNGVPQLLEVPDDTTNSRANATSSDGRLIGGMVSSAGLPANACVWIDGRLQQLQTRSGQPMHGETEHVITGIGGDPQRWLAFGKADFSANFADFTVRFSESNFVAREDGIAIPLKEWLRTEYGFSGWFAAGDSTIVDVNVEGGTLQLFVYDHGGMITHAIGSRGTSPAWRMITVPLDPRVTNDPIPEDVNADGLLTSLDVLAVVNAITWHQSGAEVSSLPEAVRSADVNRDQRLTLLDVLAVVNLISLQPPVPVETVYGLSSVDGIHYFAVEAEDQAPADEPSYAALVADQIAADLAMRRRRASIEVSL